MKVLASITNGEKHNMSKSKAATQRIPVIRNVKYQGNNPTDSEYEAMLAKADASKSKPVLTIEVRSGTGTYGLARMILGSLVMYRRITLRTARAAERSGYLGLTIKHEDYRKTKAGERVPVTATTKRKTGHDRTQKRGQQ